MGVWQMVAVGVAATAAAGLALGIAAHRRAIAGSEAAYARLVADPPPPSRRFDPASVSGLPEIAQRYFRHAIAPGTPLYAGVELEMDGIFLLGDRDRHTRFTMRARQVLRPPAQFVWIPRLRAGPIAISGSDALVDGQAWTRFRLMGLVPVADVRSSPDLVRSARFRGAVEAALWLPTTLLPEHGAHWEQTGPDRARVTLPGSTPAIVLELGLDARGAVREVVGQRWSNANRDKRFRLQPFGGTVTAESTFAGLTIPSQVAVGNHYGTADYLPFFQARITHARYF